MKTPKTWNELLDAGYVVELTEEQIAEAKEKFLFNHALLISSAPELLKVLEEVEQKINIIEHPELLSAYLDICNAIRKAKGW